MNTGLLLGLAIGVVVGVLVGWMLAAGPSARRGRRGGAGTRRCWTAERHGAQARAGGLRPAGRPVPLARGRRPVHEHRPVPRARAPAVRRRPPDAGRASSTQREQAVRAMVEPLSRTLDQVRVELSTAEQARAAGQAALGEQVRAMHQASEHLRGETAQLVTALRSSQVRGKWGELQLKRVVEAAGMLAHVDFVEQEPGAHRRRAAAPGHGDQARRRQERRRRRQGRVPRVPRRRAGDATSASAPNGSPPTRGTCAPTSTTWPPSATGTSSRRRRSSS